MDLPPAELASVELGGRIKAGPQTDLTATITKGLKPNPSGREISTMLATFDNLAEAADVAIGIGVTQKF